MALNGGAPTGLKVPPPVKKRGRPKGSEPTTIGLPTKRSKKEIEGSKPCSFSGLQRKRKVSGNCAQARTHMHTHTKSVCVCVCVCVCNLYTS